MLLAEITTSLIHERVKGLNVNPKTVHQAKVRARKRKSEEKKKKKKNRKE
jgi:hypothetical protein